MKKLLLCLTLITIATQLNAQIQLLAIGNLTESKAGPNTDLSGLHNTLESGVPANLLGGMGSAITYASGNTFLALPDRGPNADRGIPDDAVAQIGGAAVDREGHHPDTMACRQLLDRLVEARAGKQTSGGGGGQKQHECQIEYHTLNLLRDKPTWLGVYSLYTSS